PQLSIQLQYTFSHSPSLNLPNTLCPLCSISAVVQTHVHHPSSSTGNELKTHTALTHLKGYSAKFVAKDQVLSNQCL
ncbi:hypothetical protein KSS87_006940, partial [Heliosperma pusillum]